MSTLKTPEASWGHGSAFGGPLRSRRQQLIRELLTSLGAPLASVSRLRALAWVRLAVGLPFVMVPTALMYADGLPGSYQPGLLAVTFGIWLGLMAVDIAASVVILLVGDRLRWVRGLTYACITVELTANQLSVYSLGSIVTYSVVYAVMLVAAYRVAADYRFGLYALVIACVAYAGCATLELGGVLPMTPAFPYPVRHPFLDDPLTAGFGVAMVVMALLIVFVSVNFGVSQATKLHHYITQSVLRRYLPPSLVNKAAAGELRLDAPPERREVTVLFADLVGFTVMSERLGAEAVADLINRYLGEVADVSHAEGATIDKFIGDGVMLVFGAPESLPPEEQVRRAIRTAFAIRRVAATFNRDGIVGLRVGINTGEAVMGNFGSAVRSDFTVLGPVVNVAARLEAAGQVGQVLIGERTAELLGDALPLESAGPLALKGVRHPVSAYFIACDSLPESFHETSDSRPVSTS
jgi:class 3 adenylate cyclase